MDNPYLTTQLIAYIGNKRALLPFLREVFIRYHEEHRITRFADLFAGSGAVSRLAKWLGFGVHVNDWEPYAYVINSCHIGTDEWELHDLFGDFGDIEGMVRFLNELPKIEDGYISTYYAPKQTKKADYTKERLFYTRENGMFIDTVREEIEKIYPGWNLPSKKVKEKHILLASLLYQAATHANTSGVFKAFHKGFGGHGEDALSRITRSMKLLVPVLIDGREKALVTAIDAAEAVKGTSYDLCYLDPPYNQHQYGSNYHLLNTILRWDKPSHPLVLNERGELLNKGGIRTDWVETKSDFCYKEAALPAFQDIVDAVDTRYIVLSYNTEGIVPYEYILDLFDKRGRVDLYASDYITYRGGRQSRARKAHNVEFVIVCVTSETPKTENKDRINRFFAENKVRTLMKNPFNPEKIRQVFSTEDHSLRIGNGKCILALQMEEYIYFTDMPSSAELKKLSLEELSTLHTNLDKCVIESKYEECRILLSYLERIYKKEERGEKKFEKYLVRALKKIAHKKYEAEYDDIVTRIERRGLAHCQKEFAKVCEIAEKRFNG